jgi:flagellar basal-body rod protein FlgF
MDPLTTLAAGGLRARMESLDMLANNLANVATSGYKNDREFYTLYASPEASDDKLGGPQVSPLIDRAWTDYSQGTLEPTGKPLDFALDGPGFFSVGGESGPLYTRNGGFRFSTTGGVVTQEGYPLQLADGRPLQLNPNQAFQVLPDGSVSQGNQVLGRLRIVSLADAAGVSKMGANYYRAADANVASSSTAQVRQGSKENSNVSAAESAVRLVTVMRQFEMLQKAVSIGAEMNRKAAEEVAKV